MERRKPKIPEGRRLNAQGKLVFEKGMKRAEGSGRKKGQVNQLPLEVKQAVLEAITRYGQDGEGKEGMIGYFFGMIPTHRELIHELVMKILPMQFSGPNGQPLKISVLSPEILSFASEDQLHAIAGLLENLTRGTRLIAQEGNGDASKYAQTLDLEADAVEVKH